MVPELIRPPRLVPGDRVAVVAPAGLVPEDRLQAGCQILRSWDLDVVVMPHVGDHNERFHYLAGNDADRVADLTDAWCDPTVAAVLCARGGYGAQRIIEMLDWAAMGRAESKIFAGFSDITALHEAFATHLGVSTLYAPMAASPSFITDPGTADHLRRTLFEPESAQTLTSPSATTVAGGTAQGVTVGGCLALLAAELATPTGRDNVAGGILLLEDTDEKAYQVDRFLTQLLRAGWLDGVAGIALGSWKGCEPVEGVLADRLGGLGVPIISELGFGHGDTFLTVPLGVPAAIDAEQKTLTLTVPALT